MKVSMSLPAEDVAFLDRLASERGFASRSAVLQQAITLLRSGELKDAYADAWQSWSKSGDAEAWDATAADGLDQ